MNSAEKDAIAAQATPIKKTELTADRYAVRTGALTASGSVNMTVTLSRTAVLSAGGKSGARTESRSFNRPAKTAPDTLHRGYKKGVQNMLPKITHASPIELPSSWRNMTSEVA